MHHKQNNHLSARFFPNIGSVGFYSPHSLAITLNVPQPLDDKSNIEAWYTKNISLLVHEYQHALDHIGTITGRILLDSLRKCYDELELKLQRIQPDLHHWVDFHEAQKRFYRRAYFTDIDPTYQAPYGCKPRWGWEMSIGQGFDTGGHPNPEDPILFIRFRDLDRGEIVARQPMTAAALFEARAMACEIELLSRLKAIEYRDNKQEWDLFSSEQLAMFYDAGLTVYSAPVHLLATHLGISDPVIVYRLAAILAYVALNITNKMEFSPHLPAAWADAGAEVVSFKQRFVDLRDPGFSFFCLAVSAPAFEGNEDAWLDACLDRAGFPKRDVIEAEVYNTLLFPSSGSSSGTFRHIYWSACASGATNSARLRSSFGLLDLHKLQCLGTTSGPIALPNTIVGTTILSPSKISPFMSVEEQRLVGRMEELLADHSGEFLAACR